MFKSCPINQISEQTTLRKHNHNQQKQQYCFYKEIQATKPFK
uniref:Uncharacterized protein n=1 Tax=Rhizophora mucronata TaxID=61149 RepID=A0A2P2PCG1_RHIMU